MVKPTTTQYRADYRHGASFLSPQELSDLLQVPLGTIYRWRYIGDGPLGIKVGRHVRYRPADVARWLKSRETR